MEIKDYVNQTFRYLNSVENVSDRGIQGNIFLRLIELLGYKYDECIFEFSRNGASIDCCFLIDNDIVLPCKILNYVKADRDSREKFENKFNSSCYSTLRFMKENNLNICMVTDGFYYVFYEMQENDKLKLCRIVSLDRLLEKDKDDKLLDDYTFFMQFSKENIKKYLEKYCDLDILREFVTKNILVADPSFVNYVNNATKEKYTGNMIIDMLLTELFPMALKKHLECKTKNIVSNQDNIKAEKETNKGIIDEFAKIDEDPVEFWVNDDAYEFKNWRNFLINVINTLLKIDYMSYLGVVDRQKDALSFNIVRCGDDNYEQTKNNANKKYNSLNNDDLIYVTGNKRDIISVCQKILGDSNVLSRGCLVLIYEDGSDFVVY